MIDKDFYDLVMNGNMRSGNNWGTGIILQHPITKKILLAKRVDTHTYASPGGKVEFNESPKNGILRECIEESNVKVNTMYCYDFGLHTSPNGKNWTSFYFYSDSFDDANIKNQESEMEEFEWFDVVDALNLDLFEPTRKAIMSAISNKLLTTDLIDENFIPFVECPSSGFLVRDSYCCAYSYEPIISF